MKVMVWTHPPAGETGWCGCFLAGCAGPGEQEGTELGEAVTGTIRCWALRGAGCSAAGSVFVRPDQPLLFALAAS